MLRFGHAVFTDKDGLWNGEKKKVSIARLSSSMDTSTSENGQVSGTLRWVTMCGGSILELV